MRIGFDAKRLFNNFTGLGNYSRFVVDALADHHKEHQYLLYTPKLKQHKETDHYLADTRFKIIQPQGLAKTFSSYWRSFLLGNVAGRDGVQLFHGLSNELPASKPRKLKTVVTVHDLIFKRFPHYYNPIDVQIYSWKLRKACASADLIIAVSQQTANDLQEFLRVPREKIRVVYQGCHPNFRTMGSKEQRELVKKKYDLPDQFILYVGTLEERKNAALLLKALATAATKLPVVLVGKQTAYQKKLDEIVTGLKLGERVQFLHHVSFSDLPLVYQNASVFVYPSFFEGFGIPIVEAIVSGLPVITSHGSCFDEAGGPATRYINPTQPEELSLALDEILTSEPLRLDMIKRSKEYVSHFEPPIIADKIMGVYKELV